MTLTGKQKAAMLLMSLDTATAAELVKGLDHKAVQELAVELAYLDAAGLRNGKASTEVVQQFCTSLRAGQEFHLSRFLNDMLRSTVGQEKTEQIQIQIRDLLNKRDPFISIRSADPRAIASVLAGEHPQATAIVLSELPAKKSSAVLGLLDEDVRRSAIHRMAGRETVTTEAKARIAQTICGRLELLSSGGAEEALAARPEQSLRKVAVILRNLSQELRDGLLEAIREKDEEAGDTVANLMIVWTDVPLVTDRSLQEALRGIDAKKLALALKGADEIIAEKIRSNLSERAVATIDEETSLMSAPRKEDIEVAREEVVQVLREMNKKGELMFIEE
ncbi:MAG: FliG C-terminal domain-containing protein [Sedimentisphaerales bacterium]|jgi:flagellar motor switch protein FliG